MVAQATDKTETLSVKVAPETLATIEIIAHRDGRRVDDIVEDSLAAYAEEHSWNGNPKVNPEMMAHFEASIARNHKLMQLLAQ